MPLNVMLHDSVIPVGVNANIRFMGEAVIHYIAEDTMYVRIAGDTMNHMIRLRVIQPLTIVNFRISRFRGWQECEIAYNTTSVLNNKTAMLIHVADNDIL